jgi:hypothetical protein
MQIDFALRCYAMRNALCAMRFSMENMEYKHTQIGYVILSCGAAAFFIALEVFFRKASGLSLLIGLAAILVLTGVFGTLTVEIREGLLKFRFGLGLIRKTLQIAAIESCEIVRNPWYYGWGIHATSKGWVYNVSGFSAVEIFLNDGRRIRLGTDEPELLRKAILTAQQP